MDNKERTRKIMDALARAGDRRPLLDAMAVDVTWRWMGVDRWSRTFEGKGSVLNELFGGVDATLADASRGHIHRILADGDQVVVEHVGRSRTPDGHPYNNNYCWVLTFTGDLITEVREYMDTQLVNDTFGADPSDSPHDAPGR
ncbi:nuclear transport factor 2 family protein [Arthrobacter sp. JSM 101049]|uniref:nuclear transport factor 2 family protein n=1 Tax=Arthrobacter sp. JSM 101049 TaxID=929097 RepID=UPI00356A6343